MILIGIGSNLPGSYGSPEVAVSESVRVLNRRGLRVVKISRLWITAPVPASDQPWYRNAVVDVETDISPDEILKILQETEKMMGRLVNSRRDAPRVIDLDLLSYKDAVRQGPGLILPHPRMHLRGFVLLPLREIAPEWIHPLSGLSVDEMIKKMPPGQRLEPLEEGALQRV